MKLLDESTIREALVVRGASCDSCLVDALESCVEAEKLICPAWQGVEDVGDGVLVVVDIKSMLARRPT